MLNAIRLVATTAFALLVCATTTLAQAPAPAPASPAQSTPTKPLPAEKVQYVEFKTSAGSFVIEVDETNAPKTAANFIQYVKDGFYDGTIFHRVIPGFVVQGGGFSPDMVQKQTREPVANEWQNGLKNNRGTLSMARLGGKPDSATSQFFINLVDNQALDRARDGAAYAVFGHIVSGMDVVDKIAATPTHTFKGHGDVPKDAISVESARLVEKPKSIPATPIAPAGAPAAAE